MARYGTRLVGHFWQKKPTPRCFGTLFSLSHLHVQVLNYTMNLIFCSAITMFCFLSNACALVLFLYHTIWTNKKEKQVA